jgi:nitroreductase
MEFTELINKRYSVRSYKDTPIEQEKLVRILEAAVLAPTAANRQAFKLIIIKTDGRESELESIYKAPFFTNAPLVLAMIGLPGDNWVRSDGHNYNDVDCAIVMDHVVLAAANEGLGTCWIGAFNADTARAVLKLPDYAEPVAFTPLGYSDDSSKEKVRKSVDELVKYESW